MKKFNQTNLDSILYLQKYRKLNMLNNEDNLIHDIINDNQAQNLIDLIREETKTIIKNTCCIERTITLISIRVPFYKFNKKRQYKRIAATNRQMRTALKNKQNRQELISKRSENEYVKITKGINKRTK